MTKTSITDAQPNSSLRKTSREVDTPNQGLLDQNQNDPSNKRPIPLDLYSRHYNDSALTNKTPTDMIGRNTHFKSIFGP